MRFLKVFFICSLVFTSFPATGFARTKHSSTNSDNHVSTFNNMNGQINSNTSSACNSSVISSGFGLSWENLNHRISFWEMYPDLESCPDFENATNLNVGYIGGTFTTDGGPVDIPSYEYAYTAIGSSADLEFYPVSIGTYIDSSTFFEKTIPLNIDNLPFLEDDNVTIFINGLTINTDIEQTDPDYPSSYSPAYGYTSKGMGVWINDIDWTDSLLNANLWLRFEPAPADRPAMNSAIPHSRIWVEAHLMVVSLKKAVATNEISGYRLKYPPAIPLIEQKIPHAPSIMRRLSIDGEPNMPLAFLAIKGFNFNLFQDSTEGDYIRELSVDTKLLSYDNQTGRAIVDLDGYASNASLFTNETMDNEFSAEVALIQFDNANLFYDNYKSASFETGSVVVPLD